MKNTQMVKQSVARKKELNIPFHVNNNAILGLIERLAGKSYADSFIIQPLNALEPGMDRFMISDTIENGKSKILIEATSGVAAASAFNWYLKNRCGCYVGPITRRLNFPANPPVVGAVHSDDSVFLYRYFLNFCTFGYTFSFWNWNEWEPFLDWMLLSGYNLVLNPIGQEMVWLRLLTRHGYSEQEAKEFISGPTFFPWQCMMNLTGWGGPAPDHWINEQIELAKQFNQRLQSFGVGIVLPGFSGMVPRNFVNHFPDSHPMGQGLWCDFPRPDLLLDDDPMFNILASDYYHIQVELFGDNFHYFSTDPFHEGGDSRGVDLARYSKACYNNMRVASENAVWFLQGWQSNPIRDMLNALEPENVLIGNLLAETSADGGDDFAGYPWIYCCVNNFGGQRLFRGNMKKMINEPYQYIADEEHTMVGIGLMPEGVEIDEILFDIFTDFSIHSTPTNENEWLHTYLCQRYGYCSESVFEAWKMMKDYVYLGDTSSMPKESAFCTRPSLTIDRVSTYWYDEGHDKEHMKEAFKLLATAIDQLENNDQYRLDITDFARQTLANEAWDLLKGLQKAYIMKDRHAFNTCADTFLAWYYIQDELVATNHRMLLGPWLESAKSHAQNKEEEAYFEFLARTLITLWGDREASVGLRDYAAKEWSGMLLDFYRPRWESYINLLRISMVTGKEILDYNRYDAEYMFTTLSGSYPTKPKGDLKSILNTVLATVSFNRI